MSILKVNEIQLVSGTALGIIGGLHVTTTTDAFRVPRLTTAQRDALTAVDGMIIMNTTTAKLQGRQGDAWVDLV